MSQDQNDWPKRAELIRQSKIDKFRELLRLSGLDPARDLRFADWSGCDFSGCDLTGFDFTGSRLIGCSFKGVKILGARFDGAEIDHIRLYTGDISTVHDQKKPRMSPLRQAVDWAEYKKGWARISRSSLDAIGELAIGEVAMDERRISDDHLPTGAVFQDAPFAPEMVMVPSGIFMMGSPEAEGGGDEHPQHEVTISQRFTLSRYAVTFEEWDAYVAETDGYKPKDQGWGRGRRPVINVSWKDVQAYIKWLNDKTGQTYRLPTEAEWEYACRAGTVSQYSFGDDITKQQAQFSGNDFGRAQQTVEVGRFPANEFGLYDMHGNVWEWCDDWYGDYEEGAQIDPPGASSGSNRVLRGGSWSIHARFLRSANRSSNSPVLRFSFLGFRLLRQPS